MYINEDSKTLDTVKLRVLTRLVLKQIAYEGDFRSLFTVTFSQKVDFLIINAHQNSRLYGMYFCYFVKFIPSWLVWAEIVCTVL